MRMNTALKICIATAVAATWIAGAPQIARGQICAGSHLTYIVRDARGVAIDAARQDLRVEVNNGSTSTLNKWGVSDRRFIRVNKKVPRSVSQLEGKIAALETSGMCIFKGPVKLQLTLEGKRMNLIFLMPKLSEYDSRDFLVDSLPFRSGKFEIKLRVNADRTSRFYPATGWKRVSR